MPNLPGVKIAAPPLARPLLQNKELIRLHSGKKQKKSRVIITVISCATLAIANYIALTIKRKPFKEFINKSIKVFIQPYFRI